MELDEFPANEAPLDNLVLDGGYTAVLRKIACIGDSLSSGEFEAAKEEGSSTYHDMYEYSWGQFLARMCGSTVYNFSRGGMTAKCYWKSFAEEGGFWNPKLASQAYIMALGENDLFGRKQTLGTAEDCDSEEKDTFAWYFGAIIKRLKTIQPRAKFFLITMPRSEVETRNTVAIGHQKLMHDFAAKFDNTYVIDLFAYAPVYDEAFKKQYFMRGHMNPMGYLLSAKMIASYIDWIIRHNMEDFKEVGFIGTDLHS